MPSQHRSLQENRRATWEMVSGGPPAYRPPKHQPLLETRNLKLETVFPYRLYWFCFFSAWRSNPNRMSRSISSAYGTPVAAHSLGYMLIEVNPGMVLISFT